MQINKTPAGTHRGGDGDDFERVYQGYELSNDQSQAHRLFRASGKGFASIKGDVIRHTEDGMLLGKVFDYAFGGNAYDPADSNRAMKKVTVRGFSEADARDRGAVVGLQLSLEDVQEGAPEHEHAQVVVGIWKEHDELVENAESALAYFAAQEEYLRGLFSTPEGHVKHKALRRHYGERAAVDMALRFRAMRHENWSDLEAKSVAETQAAEARSEVVMGALAEKFQAVFESLTDEEREAAAKIYGVSPETIGAMAAGEVPPPVPASPPLVAPVSIEELLAGEQLAQAGLGVPSDWIELGPGVVLPGIQRVMTPEEVESLFPGFLGGPQQAQIPSPYETFDLGRGDAQSQHFAEAAQGETDALRARMHADEGERSRKVSLVKDVAAGALHWLLEKVEGPRAPLPAEPRGPLEALMAKAGVNGGRQQVLAALNEATGPEPFVQTATGPEPFVQTQPRVVPLGTFAPGEEEAF